MKRIKFLRDELYESLGRNKGPLYKEGSTHDFEDPFADRWLRREAAVEVHTREPLKPGGTDDDKREPAVTALADQTIAQLRALAAAEEIDLGQIKKQAEIVAAIETARKAKAEQQDKSDDVVPLTDQTIEQLRETADREEVDLGDATSEADIISAIELAREEKAQA